VEAKRQWGPWAELLRSGGLSIIDHLWEDLNPEKLTWPLTIRVDFFRGNLNTNEGSFHTQVRYHVLRDIITSPLAP